MSRWERVPLADVVHLKRGFDLPETDRRPGIFPVVGSAGVSGWHDEGPITGPGVTVGRSGTSIGVATYVPGTYWPLNTTLFVEDFLGNEPRFVYYLLRNIDFRGFNSGSAQPSLNRNYIAGISVRLPSTSEQRAIATLLGALDDKIVVNEQISTTSRLLGDAIFASFIARSLKGDLIATKLGDIAKRGHLQFGDGYRTKKSEHGSPGIPILRVAEVLDGFITPKREDNVHERFRVAMGAKVSRPGDVVLTTKGTVGRVAVIAKGEPAFVYSPQLCYFRPSDGMLSSSYLFYWFRSERFWSQARSLKGQTDMADYINLADISSLVLDVPVSDASDFVLKDLVCLEAAVEQAHREMKALAELRNALLPGLMSGAIRVRDAEKAVEDAT